MSRETLLDFFADLSTTRGVFLVYDDGLRSWSYTYAEMTAAARGLAARLANRGLRKGDKVIIVGENCPEWVVALWGCILNGIIVVPIDAHASPTFLTKVAGIVEARLILTGRDVAEADLPPDVMRWPLAGLLESSRAAQGRGPYTASPTGSRAAQGRGPCEAPAPVHLTKDDVAEILFTSGATAEPKGVVITHRNILANLVPVETQVAKYRKYGRPFFPLRFLNLLPLSHLFGQAMATFIPPVLPGVVVFMRGYSPHEIVRQINTRRISVMVSVPKMLDVLARYLSTTFPETTVAPATHGHWTRRWWRHRRVHRALGMKFWSFVVGAAPLDPALEDYFRRLGLLVIQGYGLTETAPIVTLNHPLATSRGSVGTPLPGVDVRIAPDGEVLVRGDNVTTGYYAAPAASAEAFDGGWLHTGDIGHLDEEGRLFIRGRKKEMIVTPEGLNVFPDDVERALVSQPGVRDAAVVGRRHNGEERVHAVLIVEDGTDVNAVVRAANAALDAHQRIRGVSKWPGAELPRTEGTRKLKRQAIKAWVESGSDDTSPARLQGESVEALLGRFARSSHPIDRDTTLDELGLTSLERVELLMALEERFDVTLDESVLARARSVADLHALVDVERPDVATPGATRAVAPAAVQPLPFPSWNRRAWARALRHVSLPSWILPLLRLFVRLDVRGQDHVRHLEAPVLFAANHQSLFDTPTILAAMPSRARYRVAVAMAKELFPSHFSPQAHGRVAWLKSSVAYWSAALFFNAFPLPQREAGTRETLRYAGGLVSDGYSLLLFPEGKRTEHGEINPFQAGVGMMAARLGLPVVPVRIVGLDRVLHRGWGWPKPGRVSVVFGAPITLTGDDYAALAERVEAAVRGLVPAEAAHQRPQRA